MRFLLVKSNLSHENRITNSAYGVTKFVMCFVFLPFFHSTSQRTSLPTNIYIFFSYFFFFPTKEVYVNTKHITEYNNILGNTRINDSFLVQTFLPSVRFVCQIWFFTRNRCKCYHMRIKCRNEKKNPTYTEKRKLENLKPFSGCPSHRCLKFTW